MKKTLFLKVEYLDLKKEKISTKTDEKARRQELFNKAIKSFKESVRDLFLSGDLTIIREGPSPEIVVEYDGKNKEIYPIILKSDIVEIIDSSVYKEEI